MILRETCRDSLRYAVSPLVMSEYADHAKKSLPARPALLATCSRSTAGAHHSVTFVQAVGALHATSNFSLNTGCIPTWLSVRTAGDELKQLDCWLARQDLESEASIAKSRNSNCRFFALRCRGYRASSTTTRKMGSCKRRKTS